MKLLAAIKCGDNIEKLDMTLRWASRSGYDLKLFVPKDKLAEYANAIADANYHWYLAADPEATMVEAAGETDTPMTYAQVMGYDLLLRIPEGLELWRKDRTFEGQVFFLCDSAGRARLEFSKNPRKRVEHWRNGATMERVRKL